MPLVKAIMHSPGHHSSMAKTKDSLPNLLQLLKVIFIMEFNSGNANRKGHINKQLHQKTKISKFALRREEESVRYLLKIKFMHHFFEGVTILYVSAAPAVSQQILGSRISFTTWLVKSTRKNLFKCEERKEKENIDSSV